MNENFNSSLSDAREIADELRQQLHLYQESILDPDATISLPDLKRMCQLADALSNKLSSVG
jgi:hypothetical protein